VEPYAILEFGHSCYKICLVYFKFPPNINFFATAREQLELFVEASHSSRNSSLLKILSTQMVPQVKIERKNSEDCDGHATGVHLPIQC
jgi:hypothetical protein